MEGTRRARTLKRVAFSLVAVALLGISPSALQGQGTSYLTGYVLDPSEAAVPAAPVVIRNENTGVEFSLKTNESGLYRSPNLIPGRYQVTVSVQGFETLVQTGVVLDVGQPRGLNLHLKVGAISQRVEVTASAALMRTEEPGLGQSVETAQVATLPMFNRTGGSLAQLSPGVRYIGEDYITGASRFSSPGMGNVQVNLDGGYIGSDRTDVNQMSYNPPTEALSELRVIANQYSAEHGQDVGALVTMSSKSGTNNYHGTAYYYLRNEALDTYDGWAQVKPLDRRNVFGGSLGGPIKRDKLHFFVNAERQIADNPGASIATVPTPAMLNGDFSGLKDNNGNVIPIYDPATTRTDPITGLLIRDQFPGNIIPPDRFDAVAKNVIKYFPAPDLPGTITGGSNLTAVAGDETHITNVFSRIDYEISPANRLTAGYAIFQNETLERGIEAYNKIDPGASPPGASTTGTGFETRSEIYNVEYTHLFSPSMFMVNRVSYRPRHLFRKTPAVNPEAHYAETIGIKGYAGERLPEIMSGGDLGFPSFRFSGYTGLGPGYLLFQEKPVHTFDYYNNLTYVRGKHTLKWGFHAEQGVHGGTEQARPTGYFSFAGRQTSDPQNGATGNSIASLLLGLVNYGLTQTNPQMEWYNWYYGTFMQDDWKVTPKLTFNFGIRWDIDAPVYERVNNMGQSFDINQINPVSGVRGVFKFLGRNGWPDNFYNTDYHRFSPRFGFAYQPFAKTVVRGGYGWYSISPVLGINARAPGDGFGTVGEFPSLDGGISPGMILEDGFGWYPLGGDESLLTDAFMAVPLGTPPIRNVGFVERDWKFGYSQNFNLSIQRELPWNMLVEVAGQGVLGRNLPITTNLNEVPPEFWGMSGPNFMRQPFPTFGGYVGNIKSASGTTNYYGGYVRVEKRFSEGLSLISNYSWGKTLGFLGGSLYYPELSYGPGWYHLDNATNPGSISESRHTGLISWLYQLPAGPGKKYLSSGLASKILGGWDVSGILSMRTGQVQEPSSGIDSLNANSPLASRLNLVGNPIPADQTNDHWWDRNAFAQPAMGEVGKFCCGQLYGPGQRKIDLAVGKTTSVTERFKVRFTAEFFNFTNTPQYAWIYANYMDPNFGRVAPIGLAADGVNVKSPMSAARIAQLGLRVEF